MDRFDERVAEAYRYLATSDAAAAQAVRRLYRGLVNFSIPAPKVVVTPVLMGYRAARYTYSFGMRVLVCQPFFAAYCKKVGKNLRTGERIHWVQGQGDIIIGDDVWLDGVCGITFAARFAERPTLEIGDGTTIGHDTTFAIGKRITIGKNCNISGATAFFDSNGHPSDPVARRNHEPPAADQVRPITVGDDVWVGKGCIIFPGVRIGDCAIISAGSVVRRHVPAYGVVAGNPAQLIFRLPRPSPNAAPSPSPTAAREGDAVVTNGVAHPTDAAKT